MKYVLFQLRKLIRRIFQLFSWSTFYFTKTGLKYINPKVSYKKGLELEKKVLQPNELFLFADGLRDEFTLLNEPIKNAPHYQLMKDLKNGLDIKNNVYILFAAKGKLDMRDEIFYPMKYYVERFKKQVKAIENNTIEPIKVLPLNGKYYILDGKHRAALFALLNKEIDSFIVSDLCDNAFFKKTLWHLEKSETREFKHNITILKKALNI